MPDEPNSNEGADPTDDIRKQNPGEVTSADLGSQGDDKNPNKTQDLTRAGRDYLDPNEGSE